MKTKLTFFLFFIFSISCLYSQRPTKIEVTDCYFSTLGEYIEGPDINGCQCFDSANGGDRIAVWTDPNLPNNQAIVFEAGKTCGGGDSSVTNLFCLSSLVSDNCQIIDSHGSPSCSSCIITVLERDPCFDILPLNDQIIPEATYQSFESIHSNGIVAPNTEVIFKSNEIELNPGYEVLTPAIFEAIIEPDDCFENFCPPIEDAPTFVQAIADLSVTGDANCMAAIQISFQVKYQFPDRLSASTYSYNFIFGYNNSSIMITLDSIEGTIVDYALSGTVPVGTNVISIDVVDENCNLIAQYKFTVNVSNSTLPSITCPTDKVISLNQNCTATIANYISEISITNTCTSDINFGDITQSPATNTLLTGVSTTAITMMATNYDGSMYTCQFHIEAVDLIAPTINCPSVGYISVPLDANCQPRIPDLRSAVDNCDGVLVPSIGDGAGPRVYQEPRPGLVWDGNSDMMIVAVDGSGNRDSCSVQLQRSCPSFQNSPSFLQSLPDLSSEGDGNCELAISLPFAIDYCMPDFLSVSPSVTGPNAANANLTVTNIAINGTQLDYTLSGTIPFGVHTVTVVAQDLECNLSASESFNVSVVDPGLPPTFTCRWLVIEIDPSGTVPLHSSDIVSQQYDCYPSSSEIISSFSSDPTDNERVFTCDDLGGQQMTVFTWDVLDANNDGVLDTLFKNPCITIQTIVDPQGHCD